MSQPVVGLDLGGTHVRAALVRPDGTIDNRIRLETPSGDPEPTVLVELMEQVAAGYGVERAVVGMPGVIDHDSEELVAAPNLPQRWIPLLTDAWLTRRSGMEVSLANDADLAAVGEATFGAGQAYRDVVYVTISTGVGAGVVLGSRLMRGRYSGGEVGHSIIDRTRTFAGRDGTVEGLGSGTAIGEATKAAGLDTEGGYITELVRAGDVRATEVFSEAITTTALGVVNMCWFCSPQIVVVGGGVGMNADLVLPIVRAAIAEYGPNIEPIQVEVAGLGDDAALAGAAAWWEAIGRDD